MSCVQTWKSIPDVVGASQISAAWVARMRHSAARLHQGSGVFRECPFLS